MATPVKTARVLQVLYVNPAGSSVVQSPALDLTTEFGGTATLVISNSGTGPTIGCDAVLETSRDNVNFFEYTRQTAATTASTQWVFNTPVDASIMYLRSRFVGNTAQPVVVEGYFQEFGSIS